MLRFTRAMFVLVLVALLAACSTGDSAPESSEPTFAAIERDVDTVDSPQAALLPTSTPLPTMGTVNESAPTQEGVARDLNAHQPGDLGVDESAPTQEGVALADVRTTATALSATFAPMTPVAADGAAGGIDDSGMVSVAESTAVSEVAMLPETAAVDSSVSSSNVVVQVTPLNAGEIDDNALWNDYITYRTDFLSWGRDSVRDVDINQRETITVTDAQGLPILGARVLIYSGQTLITESRTYASGQTQFFPSAWTDAQNAQSYRVVVQTGNNAYQFTLDPQSGAEWHVTLDVAQGQNTAQLDVLFLLDATGSMGDEIAQLQNNIMSISTQVNQTLGNTDVRYGLVAYRDYGDDYVTRIYDFVPDVQTFQEELNNVHAAGGGDTPEALNEGLRAAVRDVSWRGDDTIKLIFLVADAAPHLDYANDYDYSHEMVAAAWQGIKIFPIASSGLTPDGEYIFRQMAQYTMGHFIFLTYASGTSGPAGETRTDLEAGDEIQQQQNYSVEELDDLVLQRITDEIVALDTPIERQALDADLSRASVVAENTLPNFFSLLPTPQQVVAVVAPQVIEPPAPVPAVQFTVTLPQLVGVVFACLLIGYSISLVYRSEKRKRKSDEAATVFK